LRGVAICPYGADSNTESVALAKGETVTAQQWEPDTQESQMNAEPEAVEVEANVEAETAVETQAVETEAVPTVESLTAQLSDVSGNAATLAEQVTSLTAERDALTTERDEANTALGAASNEAACITVLQAALFTIGAGAHTTDPERFAKIEHRLEESLTAIEQWIEEISAPLAPLEGFIYADHSTASMMLARAIVRRAERSAVKADQQWAIPVLNAMSDLLFALSWQKASSAFTAVPQWTGV
jgi:cob(I)alamin adenosyltransferase